MILGIMQPYFLPYIGYWQLMNAVDQYVIYDNIEFTKNGWIRRNRLLSGGSDKIFTLPLKKDSDYLDIKDRYLSCNFDDERKKIIGLINASYKRAPMFDKVFPILKDIFEFQNYNLFEYIFYSVVRIKDYLNIDTPLTVSSTLDIDPTLKGKDRVLATCKKMNATHYYNAFGGVALYSPYKSDFDTEGVRINFLKTRDIVYPQLKNEFVPNLSIIDVMMFNSQEECQKLLLEYDLLYEN